MIFELFRAVLLAGLPVGVISYFLFSWALRRRSRGTTSSLKALTRELKQESKLRSKEKKEKKKAEKEKGEGKPLTDVFAEGAYLSREGQLDLLHNKWLKFGGGFYGVVGLITYAAVELGDLWRFASQFGNFWIMMTHVGLNTLIGMLVNALQNFIIAIAWPGYWLSVIHSQYVWFWFIAAYAGYWGGAKIALRNALRRGDSNVEQN